MNNGIFKLSWADLGKGLLVSIGTALVMYFQTLLPTTGFTFSAINWVLVANVAVTAGIAYLGKQLLTSNQGNIAGIGDR